MPKNTYDDFDQPPLAIIFQFFPENVSWHTIQFQLRTTLQKQLLNPTKMALVAFARTVDDMEFSFVFHILAPQTMQSIYIFINKLKVK